MNNVYRIVWNASKGAWVAAAEFAKGQGKSASNVRCAKRAAHDRGVLAVFALLSGAAMLAGLPAGYANADTIINSTNDQVDLQTLDPASSAFVVPSSSVVNSWRLNAISGDNSKDWQLTNYGNIITTSYGGLIAAVKLDSATASAAKVENFGTIKSTVDDTSGVAGIYLLNGGTVINHSEASIDSVGFYGIAVEGGNATVVNDGSISGYSSGIRLGAGGVVRQSASGTISASDIYGAGLVAYNGSIDINNAGTITGPAIGLMLGGAGSHGSVVNSGTIAGGSGVVIRASVANQGAPGIVLANSGTITGSSGIGINVSGNGHQVINSGTVTGGNGSGTAISMSGKDNQLVLQTGSVLNGAVTSTGANNTLALQGNGAANNNISGFATVTALDNGAWTLGGTVGTTGTSASTLNVQNGTLIVNGNLSNNGAGAGASVSNGGTLIVGDASHTGAALNGAGNVTVAAGGTLSGSGIVTSQVNNSGIVSALNALQDHVADPVGTLTLANGLTNSGTVNLAGGSVGNTLVVKGDYVGNNGVIRLATVMGDDTSTTDKLVLDGGHASGNTGLVIKHGGGNGAATNKGIQLVETQNGATTDANAFNLDARSDGYRQGVGSIAAGAYDYSLKRGGNGGVADDWYLVSAVSSPTPVNPDVDPTNPDVGPTPTPDVVQNYRPEVGVYLNNKLFANTMQAHTLHDRQGQAGVAGADGNAGPDASSWGRVVGSTSNRDGAGLIKDTANEYLAHVGSDVWRGKVGDQGSVRVGVMGAFGTSDNRADNGQLTAKGSVTGYSAGVYGTWYGKDNGRTGPYADTWMMYGRFDNKVNGEGLASETYISHNLAASLEAGYAIPLGANGTSVIVPQAQIIYSDYRARDHVERNGTVVSGMPDSGITTRLGARWSKDVQATPVQVALQPFAELNWWHGPDSQSLTFDQDRVQEKLPRDRAEMKVGVIGNVSRNVSVLATLGVQAGSESYVAGSGQVAVKYKW